MQTVSAEAGGGTNDLRGLLTAAGARSVSIVMPAQNEQQNITTALDLSVELLQQCCSDFYEVIVVDDASTDTTLQLVRDYAAKNPSVKFIALDKDVGPHLAVLTGFRQAKGDLLFFIPSDLQILPDQLLPCLPAMANADYVCTNRVVRADPFHRIVMARLYNAMLRRMFNLPMHDVDSSILVRKRVVDEIGHQITTKSTFILAELLIRARAAGLRIVEVTIEHHPRPAGKPAAITPKETFKTLVEAVGFLRFALKTRRSLRS